jgi:hypothetical protein
MRNGLRETCSRKNLPQNIEILFYVSCIFAVIGHQFLIPTMFVAVLLTRLQSPFHSSSFRFRRCTSAFLLFSFTVTTMASMNIVSVPGRFAVCRLSPEERLPSWILDCGPEFFSITRTDDELSIVYLENRVPANVVSERTWACLKVQGPLDFALTGILAALAQPLAEAGISIFAISTYDTDYLLVKTDKLQDAKRVLTGAGHNVDLLPEDGGDYAPLNRDGTRDGPAVEFQADPLVAPLVQVDSEKATFGLVVVAGWPSQPELQESYLAFRSAISQCFDEIDVLGSAPAVYLYPASALHVTVATFHSIQQPPSHVSEKDLAKQWQDVFEAAKNMPEWPKGPLQLSIDRAQIGKHAGILLWKEVSGGMDAMRQCIQTATEQQKLRLEAFGIDVDTLSIPSIVHSTFLRFYQQPTTPGPVIQERFHQEVIPQLAQIFSMPFTAPTVKLVCNRRPYMHVPDDEHHVLATSYL